MGLSSRAAYARRWIAHLYWPSFGREMDVAGVRILLWLCTGATLLRIIMYEPLRHPFTAIRLGLMDGLGLLAVLPFGVTVLWLVASLVGLRKRPRLRSFFTLWAELALVADRTRPDGWESKEPSRTGYAVVVIVAALSVLVIAAIGLPGMISIPLLPAGQ